MSKYKYSRKQIREQITRQLELCDSDRPTEYDFGVQDGLLFAFMLVEKEKK